MFNDHVHHQGECVHCSGANWRSFCWLLFPNNNLSFAISIVLISTTRTSFSKLTQSHWQVLVQRWRQGFLRRKLLLSRWPVCDQCCDQCLWPVCDQCCDQCGCDIICDQIRWFELTFCQEPCAAPLCPRLSIMSRLLENLSMTNDDDKDEIMLILTLI